MSGKVRAMRCFTRRSAALRAEPQGASQAKPAAAIAECQHDWSLFANELVAVIVCRRCGFQKGAS